MEDNNRQAGSSNVDDGRKEGGDANKGLKITVTVLAVVAVVLALVFAYVWYDRQQMINDLTIVTKDLKSP